MVEINQTDGFHIYGWMKTELHLDGGDLLAFAMVYSFIKSDAGIYKGNTSYLSAWTGWSERTSRAHLQKLVGMGLIKERRGRENNAPYCFYTIGPEMQKSTRKFFPCDPEKNDNSTRKKTTIPPGKNCGENRNIRIEETNKKKFNKKDFRLGLLSLGVSAEHVEDWLAVREKKKATNSRTAFDGVKREIEKAAELGLTADDCIRLACEQSWQGFKAAWVERLTTPFAGNTPSPTPSPKLSRADQAFENMMALGKKLGYVK